MHHNKLPSLSKLDEVFEPDFETGKLYWRKTRIKRLVGVEAGYTVPRGYRKVKVGEHAYGIHRILYAMHHREDPGDMEIDHINNITNDNRIVNLRLATRSLNCMNHKSWRKGLRGAYKKDGRWMAVVQVNGDRQYLGHFGTEEEAHAAFCVAAVKQRGDMARLD